MTRINTRTDRVPNARLARPYCGRCFLVDKIFDSLFYFQRAPLGWTQHTQGGEILEKIPPANSVAGFFRSNLVCVLSRRPEPKVCGQQASAHGDTSTHMHVLHVVCCSTPVCALPLLSSYSPPRKNKSDTRFDVRDVNPTFSSCNNPEISVCGDAYCGKRTLCRYVRRLELVLPPPRNAPAHLTLLLHRILSLNTTSYTSASAPLDPNAYVE